MIDRAPFGATGHESSRVIFGAAALGDVSKSDADRTLDVLLEHGINHIDVAASYGDAELRIATWLSEHEFFLATKTGERTYAAAREEIRRWLDRLGVDHVDSIQLHNLVDVIEWDIALSPGGALEACARGARRGPRALHRRDRPRALGAEDAPAQPRALRLRLRAVPVQLGARCSDPRYAETFDELARDLRRAQRRAADDQEPRSRAVGGPRAHRVDVVRAADRAGRHRPRRPLGARQPPGVPAHHRRRRRAAEAARRGGALRASAPDEQMAQLVETRGLAPLFT